MPWDQVSSIKGATGATGAPGLPGATTWAGITDKPTNLVLGFVDGTATAIKVHILNKSAFDAISPKDPAAVYLIR